MGKIDSKALASGLENSDPFNTSKMAAYDAAQRPAEASSFWPPVVLGLALQPVRLTIEADIRLSGVAKNTQATNVKLVLYCRLTISQILSSGPYQTRMHFFLTGL